MIVSFYYQFGSIFDLEKNNIMHGVGDVKEWESKSLELYKCCHCATFQAAKAKNQRFNFVY